jgi:release factor glutamine methyltransferase
MTTLSRAVPQAGVPGSDPFRPSEYTGLLVQTLRARAHEFGRGAGLDMGLGSGVLLATMGLIGVERLFGVDVDPDAIRASDSLMQDLGLAGRVRLLQGSLWDPVGHETFDVVVANLPHFAASEPSDPTHSRYWSMGGADGRALIDPFLAGLPSHLNPDGVAYMTHNVFAGVSETKDRLAAHGLQARPIMTTTTILHPMKSALLTPEIRARHAGQAISRIGPYEFADVDVIEIRRAGAA